MLPRPKDTLKQGILSSRAESRALPYSWLVKSWIGAFLTRHLYGSSRPTCFLLLSQWRHAKSKEGYLSA
eukprot:383807-Amphidinium_carterae.1